MIRLLVVVFAAVIVMAAAGSVRAETLGRERLNEARALSEADMAGLLMGVLSGRAEVSDLRVERGDVVFLTMKGHDVRMGLAALAGQFNALPDAKSRQGAFDKLTQRVAEAVAGEREPKPAAERARFRAALIPVLKNRSYVEQFAAMARRQGAPQARLLYNSIAGDMIVVAALDLPKMMRFVAVGEGGDYGMSDVDVFRTALDNWIQRAGKLEVRDSGKLRAFHFGDGDYNASILLLPDLWTYVPDLPRNVAVGVPSRDILAFADADDAEAVAALRSLTKAPDRGYPVSKQIYKLGQRGLVVIP